ncbi:hypothetical protein HII31_04280 [Pseudocercospora fuligena]|uniref:Uncharacterized protein n=1 Tax=Pseudocercospora fuligena TaxID=685502 RepID=A0A8H6RMB7_9PEZI|nr:hypothetical protein HII31_04280 [Pseudocercospora fuligena]
MAPTNSGTNYARFSRRQCFAFIRRRGGTIPPGKEGKKLNPRSVLRQMDRDARFRFMDLPPEMRNEIYTYLLSRSPKEGRKAFLDILCVSKQVHKEAVGILHAESVFSITAELQKNANGEQCRVYSKGHKRLASMTVLYGEEMNLVRSRKRLDMLRNIEKIQLRAYFCLEAGTFDFDWTSFAAFVDLLNTYVPKLKTLEVTTRNHFGPYWLNTVETPWSSALKPFSKLPAAVTLDIQGLEDNEYDEVWEEINAA